MSPLSNNLEQCLAHCKDCISNSGYYCFEQKNGLIHFNFYFHSKDLRVTVPPPKKNYIANKFISDSWGHADAVIWSLKEIWIW